MQRSNTAAYPPTHTLSVFFVMKMSGDRHSQLVTPQEGGGTVAHYHIYTLHSISNLLSIFTQIHIYIHVCIISHLYYLPASMPRVYTAAQQLTLSEHKQFLYSATGAAMEQLLAV